MRPIIGTQNSADDHVRHVFNRGLSPRRRAKYAASISILSFYQNRPWNLNRAGSARRWGKFPTLLEFQRDAMQNLVIAQSNRLSKPRPVSRER